MLTHENSLPAVFKIVYYILPETISFSKRRNIAKYCCLLALLYPNVSFSANFLKKFSSIKQVYKVTILNVTKDTEISFQCYNFMYFLINYVPVKHTKIISRCNICSVVNKTHTKIYIFYFVEKCSFDMTTFCLKKEKERNPIDGLFLEIKRKVSFLRQWITKTF